MFPPSLKLLLSAVNAPITLKTSSDSHPPSSKITDSHLFNCYLIGFLSNNSYGYYFHKFGVPFHLRHYPLRARTLGLYSAMQVQNLRSACDHTFKYSLPLWFSFQNSSFLSRFIIFISKYRGN